MTFKTILSVLLRLLLWCAAVVFATGAAYFAVKGEIHSVEKRTLVLVSACVAAFVAALVARWSIIAIFILAVLLFGAMFTSCSMNFHWG